METQEVVSTYDLAFLISQKVILTNELAKVVELIKECEKAGIKEEVLNPKEII